MAGIEFDVVITNQAINYAREVQGNIGKGWHLTPKKYGVSSVASGIPGIERTISNINPMWVQGAFSGIYPLEVNKLLNNITIPADASNTQMDIKEIYFIYENHDDEQSAEFLFAIATPRMNLSFTPGVAQSFKFLFGLNNASVESIIDINYTYPEEIDDHNLNNAAHENLVKRDGSRILTGILSYDEEKTFTSDNNLVSKKYVDDQITSDATEAIAAHNTDIHAHDYFLMKDGSRTATDILTYENEISFDDFDSDNKNIVSKGYVTEKIINLINVHNNSEEDSEQKHVDLLKVDGTRKVTGILKYNEPKTFTSNTDLIDKKYADDSITDHNSDLDAHSYLLKTDGTRDLTGILKYNEHKIFNNDSELVDKKYVDELIQNINNNLPTIKYW